MVGGHRPTGLPRRSARDAGETNDQPGSNTQCLHCVGWYGEKEVMKRLVLVLLVFGLGVGATACSDEGNVFSLEVGTCFDDVVAGEVGDVPIVDCAEAHDNEVYHLFDLPDGDFPGSSAVGSAADQGCFDAFPTFVGIDYQSSVLVYSGLVPTEESWEKGDDREVVCYLFHMEAEKLTGTQRGAAI